MECLSGQSEERQARPLLRWAGGKQRLATLLAIYLPKEVTNFRYVEPFFGAGSLFFQVRPKKALLADLNVHLMDAYIQIRNNPLQVHRYLTYHRYHDSEKHYYWTRNVYNRASRANAVQAARFIYLNRTCYNGIFRVNLAGKFNVPYGDKDNPIIPEKAELVAASRALRRTQLRCQDFRKTLSTLGANSFVYLDPPYPALNGTAFFQHYTQDRFDDNDQRELAGIVRELDEEGIPFMMSNADTPLIRNLYRRFEIIPLAVTRYVTCKSVKHQVGELVITNY
jgi:DNA adenine methylase